MPRLNIPARNREGISKLLSLDADRFEKLVATLESQSPNATLTSAFLPTINVPNIGSDEVEQIVSAIIGLHVARASRDTPPDEFVQDASQAIGAFDPAGRSEASRERLLKVINIRSLVVSAKAFSLLMDRERTLLTAKILTDLRYAFQPDPEQKPYGALVIHTLKLSYHEEGDHKDFLVALDDNDIGVLRTALDRAESKARVLRKQLESAGLADLSVPKIGQ